MYYAENFDTRLWSALSGAHTWDPGWLQVLLWDILLQNISRVWLQDRMHCLLWLLSALHPESLVCLPCSVVYSLKAPAIDKGYLRKKYTLQVVAVPRLSQFKLRFLVVYTAQFLCYAAWRTRSRSATSPRQSTHSYRPNLEINDPSCCIQPTVTFSLATLHLFVGLAQ